jgi:ribonuclease HI
MSKYFSLSQKKIINKEQAGLLMSIGNKRVKNMIGNVSILEKYIVDLEYRSIMDKMFEDILSGKIVEPALQSDRLIVYTDGACSGNGKKNASAGSGVFFAQGDTRNICEKVPGEQTNNRGELYAILLAIRAIDEPMMIYSDSMYSINCSVKWVGGWIKKNWKKSDGKDVKNREIIEEIYNLMQEKDVKFKHIKCQHDSKKTDVHSMGNKGADELAVAGAKK